MTHFNTIDEASDRVLAALVAGLDMEFGRGAGIALADHYIDAEESDFLWEMRVSERWLGNYEGSEDEDLELDRVAIIGRWEGRFYVAVSIVDGDGMVHGLMARRDFGSEDEAKEAFARMR